MKAKDEAIVMLQYRIKRYKAMGNGAMCQQLLSEINNLRKNSSSPMA